MPNDFSIALTKVLHTLPTLDDREPSRRETTDPPALIIISGLPGSGKSYLAQKIVKRLPAVIIESDWVRKLLFPKPTYAGLESAWVHRIGHAAAGRLLRSGRNVIYDATNLVEWHRRKLYKVAENADARLVIVRVVAPEHVIRRRLKRRKNVSPTLGFSDADWQTYELLKRTVQPVQRKHLIVDSTQDLNRAVTRIVRAVLHPFL